MTPGRRLERRATLRVRGTQVPVTAARIRPGGDVAVLDFSPGGTAIEGAPRLLPGAAIQVHLSGSGWGQTVTARVVHCQVSRLSETAGATYRAGLRFDRPFVVLDTR